jgi:predicted ABC-type ATPase
MINPMSPRVVVFAGPNGAGKSTHADAILEGLGIDTFVNADYIARGLTGQNTERVALAAGRIMLTRLKELGNKHVDFAFESTLSSRIFALFLRQLKAQGYQVSIYYFSLTSANLAVRRVKHRVALGGHSVPDEVVRRRFKRSLACFFQLYQPLASHWAVFDNSYAGHAELIAAQSGPTLKVFQERTWQKLQKLKNAH